MGLVNRNSFIIFHVPFDEVHHEEGKTVGEVLGREMVEDRLVEQFPVVFGGNEGALHEIENDNLVRLK